MNRISNSSSQQSLYIYSVSHILWNHPLIPSKLAHAGQERGRGAPKILNACDYFHPYQTLCRLLGWFESEAWCTQGNRSFAISGKALTQKSTCDGNGLIRLPSVDDKCKFSRSLLMRSHSGHLNASSSEPLSHCPLGQQCYA
jgi:hypothetical protein